MSVLLWSSQSSRHLQSEQQPPKTSSWHPLCCLFFLLQCILHTSRETHLHSHLELPLCLKVFLGCRPKGHNGKAILEHLKLGTWSSTCLCPPCLALPLNKSSTSSVSRYTLCISLLKLFLWVKYPSILPFTFPPVRFLPILQAPVSQCCFKRLPAHSALNMH